MLRAVLFDLDGTLLDTPAAIVAVAQETLQLLGRPPGDPLQIRATIGLPLPLALAQTMGVAVDHPEVAVAVGHYRDVWIRDVTPRVPHLLYPGVLDGLRGLQEDGLKLGVVTGKAQEGADNNVRLAGLTALMSVVLGYTSVKNPKPAPDLVLAALDRLALAPGDAVVVGDSTHDLLMARAAGVRSLAVTYGAQGEDALRSAAPTWIAHSFPEVVRILRAAASLGE